MKIIVGGAGSVGRSIISYLSRSDNDIVVIDNVQERLDEIAKEFDVQPVLGSVSSWQREGVASCELGISVMWNGDV